jgi:hypothetical protein
MAGMSSHPPDRFQLAANERDVVNAMRDAMQHWSPQDLARIPPHCRPGKLRDGEDIVNLAFTLTTTRIESDESNDVLVQLETLFARACRRISELDHAGTHVDSRDEQDAR